MQESNEQELNGLESNEYTNYIDALSDYATAQQDYNVHSVLFTSLPTPSNAAHLAVQQARLVNAYNSVNVRLIEFNQLLNN